MKRYQYSICSMIIVLQTLFLGIWSQSYAKTVPQPEETEKSKLETSPVMFNGKVLFSVSGFKHITPEQRAQGITERLKKLAKDMAVRTDTIATMDTEISTDIVSGDQIVMVVLDADARPEGRTRQYLASEYAQKIRTAVEQYRADYSRRSIIFGALYTIATTFVFILLLFLLKKLIQKLTNLIETNYKTKIRPIRIKSFEILDEQHARGFINLTVRIIRLFAILVITYTYISLVLSFFPWTRQYAGKILSYIFVPLRIIGESIIKEIPDLLFIAVLIIITRLFLKFMHMFFRTVELGTFKIQGFYQEWARPTDRLLTFLIIAFAVVVAFPYIPGSDSAAFKGVSIFIGVLFSLGSQSAMSNVIAGLVMNYRRAYKVGDRIQVGEIIGDVIETRLQVTHIRTIKNEDVIIPNSSILNSNVINYSSLAHEKGLILHTSITIGYDVPWRQVHALLLMAAERTQGLLREQSPFILQKSLGDFYVTYELNVYTDAPYMMATIYSELHKNIQDCFNEYGVQIMSPNYVLDPERPKVIPKDQWYKPPAQQQDERE